MINIEYDEANEFLKEFNQLPDSINFCDNKIDFEKQFKLVFSSEESKKAQNVIYVWSVGKNIKRLRGESNIIYIGKTTQSLYKRHYRYSVIEADSWNWERYLHIMKFYLCINFYYKFIDVGKKELEEIEKSLIWSYFKKHLEYPPFNARN